MQSDSRLAATHAQVSNPHPFVYVCTRSNFLAQVGVSFWFERKAKAWFGREAKARRYNMIAPPPTAAAVPLTKTITPILCVCSLACYSNHHQREGVGEEEAGSGRSPKGYRGKQAPSLVCVCVRECVVLRFRLARI